ncbi:MAG: response regulator [Defluviitaleaceae bacterium]|nr:response regulator [Defluviitaleaceae bacterium]
MDTQDNREIIFLVDDSEFNLEIADNILHHSYTIYKILSGKILFNLLSVLTPDLILLDIEMPEMDGYSIIRRLKDDSVTSQIPVIFLTATGDRESKTRALREGAVDYITKPINPDVLKARVEIHLLLKRQNAELQESVRSAEVASNAKSEFIAVMSHEMRTPLSAIIGFTELSLESDGLSKELFSNLINIRNAGTTLLNIISDILDISKIETGKFELIPVEYNTASILSDVLSQSILYSADKPIEFKLTIDEKMPARLYGDELRVKQILNNLLSNAFKYTHEGEVELILDCKIELNNVLITAIVKDTGIGISEENLESVFEDYTQADMTANREITGTGLGLSIARRLSKRMRGGIEVESVQGKGSTFTMKILQKFVSEKVISPEDILSLQNLRYVEKTKNHTKQPRIKLPNARILVVDDVDTNLAVAKGLLRRYSINCDCVTNGVDAIYAIKNKTAHYDAIFMDHMMPDMDGIEATKIIRGIDTEYAKNIPIIAFTANALVGNEEMFLANGFQAFISKPIEISRLDNVVKKWVKPDNATVEIHEEPPPLAVEPNRDLILNMDIEDIDIAKGLARFDGDAETYFSVMHTFAHNVPLILRKAETVNTADLTDYIIAVHGIKGACYGICADTIADRAAALETAGKDGDLEFIAANNSPFLHSIRRLLTEININLAKTEKEKQHREKPCDELLAKLLEACERHDMNEIDNVAAKLNSFTYDHDQELVQWLVAMAEEMNYNDIAERLRV